MVAMKEDENPFLIPSDDEIFKRRDKERLDEHALRHSFNSKSIWEKSTVKTKGGLIKRQAHVAKAVATGLVVRLNERRPEKENLLELIARKREMFLVQMSLDTKRKEIAKLESKAKAKEEALMKSEQMLEADAARFDKFLKENDHNAHEAIKRHDDESKIKHAKLTDIKKINHEIAKIQSDMSKYQEQLDDCLKYKHFLDSQTPANELESIEKARRDRDAAKKARKAARLAERLKSVTEAMTSEAEEHLHAMVDAEVEDEEEEVEDEMYFKDPQQLLDIFSALEERNLFLIQNSQETEEAVEDLKFKYEETKEQMEANSATLMSNIVQLQAKIEAERDKTFRLEKRITMNGGIDKQEAILQELGEKVTEVFCRCGFNPEANPDTLDKLAKIESRLESLMAIISTLPQEYVRSAEKTKEAERRDRVRKQKVLEKQLAVEERLAKSVARTTAAIPLHTGKKNVFRSPPLKRKKKKKTNDKVKQEQELLYKKYFTSEG